MTTVVSICWLALAALHVVPTAAFFSPNLTARLYAVDATGDAALLLRHRGAMFVSVIVSCTWALLDSGSRRLASAVVAVSMVSFLVLYLLAGRRHGALALIAGLDAIGLVPLLVVSCAAWRSER